MAQEGRSREQEETGCHQPAGLVLCANNCGLFGSEATLNFCSKCYHEVVVCKANAFSSMPVGDRSMSSAFGEKPISSFTDDEKTVNLLPSVTHQEPEPMDSSTTTFPFIASRDHMHQSIKIPNRCTSCRKRVGLTGFRCRCGDLFCSMHRYSDKHNCSFDYKAAGRHAIAKDNPLIKADKIQRI